MKVLLVNGSPNEHGCTYTALSEIAKTLKDNDIDSDFFWIGKKPISGCIACHKCFEQHYCVFGDKVNEFTDIAKNYDGFIFGSPVYFSGMNGSLMSFMDRAFFSQLTQPESPFAFKPAAAIVSARRAGTTSALDQMNKYFLHQQMPIVSSRYWNMVHGMTPDEVYKDKEGIFIMHTLATNMAWFLKIKEAGIKAGITLPVMNESGEMTNFIR